MPLSLDITPRLGMNPEIQRKLYNEEMFVVASVEVWGPHSFHLAIQFMFEECQSSHVDWKFLIPFGSTGQ